MIEWPFLIESPIANVTEVDGWEKYYIPDTTQNIEGAAFILWEEMLCLHTKWVENISVQWKTEK